MKQTAVTAPSHKPGNGRIITTMIAKDSKPCKRCGGTRKHKRGECAQCKREYDRRRRETNPERLKENGRRWQQANPEKVRESARRRREKNPEKARESVRRWRQENAEKNRENTRIWRQANPGRNKENIRQWCENNPDKLKSYGQKRRAKERGAEGKFTAAEWREVVRQQDGRCLACGKTAKLTADHVIPLDKGGSNDISNIQGLCKICNSSKGTKSTDYRKEGGILRWIQRRLFE